MNWSEESTVPAGSQLVRSTYDGRAGVVDLTASRAGVGLRQTGDPPLGLASDSRLSITFRIDSASLTGDGWYGIEGPIVLRVTSRRPDGTQKTFTRYYNYTADEDSSTNPSFELVPQAQWVDRTYDLTAMDMTTDDLITMVYVGSSGWQRQSYVDRVELQP